MSDHITFDLQAEIMKRLPVKSLIQFRSVSKAWKSHIDSSDFIAHYSSQQQHLLVRYEDAVYFKQKYVSVVDDDSFPQHKVSLALPQWLTDYNIIGCCYGLLCLYSPTGRAVLWNPSIKKAVDVVVPNVADKMVYDTLLGFGVCQETTDPKIVIVKVTHIKRWMDVKTISCIPWQVEVFTLSTRGWRSPCSTDLPRKSIRFCSLQVVVDGFIYWLATDRIEMDGGFRSYNLIISFDMISEEFREVSLPDSLALAHHYDGKLSMSTLRESLVVLDEVVEAYNPVFGVWMMEDAGVAKSFTKLFTFSVSTPDVISLRGFRKTSEPIVEIIEDYSGFIGALAVYEPYSKHINNLGINGDNRSFSVYPYMETLLLLDQPDFITYDKGKRDILNRRRLLKHTSKV
ncbi:hypothetical protein L1987_65246 [Smallanthus sonchifolius]|uniref:Uncharacterized protein n=1 Tax=Smallanthus sonchifolius TaxID=185202 RepID=A0ACB9BTV2_9ASTR|nr:hypothetical protein L1987_65246 [Smallanthus sonchifolius]